MADKIKIGGELDPRTPEKILGDASTIKDRTWANTHSDVAQTPNQKQDEINEYLQKQIDNIVATEQSGIQTDASPVEDSVKLVQSGGTYAAIKNAETTAKTFSTGETVPNIGITSTPTNDTNKLVTSKGVKDAIENIAFSTNEKVANVGIDAEPTADSENLVKSGGVQNELTLGAVYDVSAKNPTAGPNNDGKWESLSALLSDANLSTLIPTSVRKGGMSIKFICSSDNLYVQYRLMSETWSVNVLDWENTDNTIRTVKEEYNNGSIALNLIPKSYIDVDGEQKYISNFYSTDFIRLRSTRLKIYSPISQLGNFSSFYDENREQVSAFNFIAGENVIDVPSNAVYFRTSIQKDSINDTYVYSEQAILTQDFKKIGFDTLKFVKGYYDLTNGNPILPGITNYYYRSQIVPCTDWRELKGVEQLTDPIDYFALWMNGVYVGYELTSSGKSSMSYNQVACVFKQNKPNETQREITIWTNPFLNTSKPTQSRYDNLKDKKIGFLGDSITYGVGASTRTKTSYVALMQNEFNTVINYGISSTYIEVMPNRNDAMCDRYINMSDDLDIVVVYGGTNDWYYGQGWGSIDSTDKETFLGALNVLMSGLVQKYCGKEIFVVTPMSSDFNGFNTDNPNPNTGKTMLDYRNAIIERAAYHGIPVIDLYGMCGMDVAHNAANKTYYSSDGVHPNDAGHKRVHDRIVAFISNILY